MAYFNRNDRQNDQGSYGDRRDFGDRGNRGGRGGPRGDRRMYPAICDKCGRECQVPFRPDGSKPIYCSSCFEKKQNDFGQGRDNYGGRNKSFNDRSGGQRQNQNQNNEVLASINSKLAQILELMRNNTRPSQKVAEAKAKKKTRLEKKTKKKTKTKKVKK